MFSVSCLSVPPTPMSKTKPDITVTIKDEWEMRESVIRTSAGSKKYGGNARAQGKTGDISATDRRDRPIHFHETERESSFVGKYENITRGVII